MTRPILYSIIDTPTHPDFSRLYARLGFEELRLPSQRKAISELKKRPPAVVVGEFINAFHTYYQATNISNLDVFLQSLVKYAPETRVVVVIDKKERQLAEKLGRLHPWLTLLERPLNEAVMEHAVLQPSTAAPK